jgi:basic amino acid/polyamine antiporter, APA family
MSRVSHKIGFWSVFALVTGSQIGSGVFMLPAVLARYGLYSIAGWVLSSIGAVALALVFAQLCEWFPKTGGPHVYIKQAFGDTAAFFTGWTYWVISWVSTTVVIIASIGYLTPLIGQHSSFIMVCLQIALLAIIIFLNFYGVTIAGRAEFVLTVLKIVPLCIIPLAALWHFNIHNFFVDPQIAVQPSLHIISRVVLLTLWGFIGLESATTPADAVVNPSVTIPRALITGTICVALVYLCNSMAVMGIIPGAQLMLSNAPYVDAAQVLFGGNWHLVISIIASIICIGTLNAWVLTSGQIALGLAQDGLMPSLFGVTNKYNAPYWSIALSGIGTVPLLIMTAEQNLASQILSIIDFSVTAFLFVYAVCCIAFLALLMKKRGAVSNPHLKLLYGLVGLLFCVWVIYETPLSVLLTATLFTIVGIPLYGYLRVKKYRAKSV